MNTDTENQAKDSEQENSEDVPMPITAHLSELRTRLVHSIIAILGIFVAKLLLLSTGNALLFAVLCASASYLAVPAAMRMTVPEAKPSYNISTTLGLTFPFNIVIGIPLYLSLIHI